MILPISRSSYKRTQGLAVSPNSRTMSYPATVKGVGIKQNGGVEVIENLELPFPEVHPGDMLVKVMDHLYS